MKRIKDFWGHRDVSNIEIAVTLLIALAFALSLTLNVVQNSKMNDLEAVNRKLIVTIEELNDEFIAVGIVVDNALDNLSKLNNNYDMLSQVQDDLAEDNFLLSQELYTTKLDREEALANYELLYEQKELERSEKERYLYAAYSGIAGWYMCSLESQASQIVANMTFEENNIPFRINEPEVTINDLAPVVDQLKKECVEAGLADECTSID